MRNLICLFALFTLITCTTREKPERPNVLFITVDDLNDWVGITKAHPLVQTPNLDRFFESAVYFNNAHCVTPICQASRNSMLTGQPPYKTGWYSNYNHNTYEENNQISERIHLSEYVRKNGYYTMAAGKIYHTGIADIRKDSLWDEYVDLDAWKWQKPDYFNEYDVNYDKRFQPFPERGGKILSELGIKSGFSLCGGPAPVEELPEGKMHDGFITDWAIEKLNEKRDKPFYLAIGYHRPHMPYTAPKEYFDMYPLESIKLPDIPEDEFEDIPIVAKAMALGLIPGGDHAAVMKLGEVYWKELIQAYLACITFVDHTIGRLLSELDKNGLADNTIVILVSDHGQNLGEKKNWRKMCLWEESTKVPLAVRVPGIPGGVQNLSPASLLDIYPTLMDLLQLEKPGQLAGKSLQNIIYHPEVVETIPVITTWLYKNHSIRSMRYRYTIYRDGAEEFYDHDTDPEEHLNLINDSQLQEIINWHKGFVPGENAIPADKSEIDNDRLDQIMSTWEGEGVPGWLQ